MILKNVFSNRSLTPSWMSDPRPDSSSQIRVSSLGRWLDMMKLQVLVCNPMDCSPPGSSVYLILLARILEWVAITSEPPEKSFLT